MLMVYRCEPGFRVFFQVQHRHHSLSLVPRTHVGLGGKAVNLSGLRHLQSGRDIQAKATSSQRPVPSLWWCSRWPRACAHVSPV